MMLEKHPASSKKIALTPSTAREIRRVLKKKLKILWKVRSEKWNSAVYYHWKIPV